MTFRKQEERTNDGIRLEGIDREMIAVAIGHVEEKRTAPKKACGQIDVLV
jgi:hypothetical protein